MNMASNILVVMPSWIGDAVMATPVLKALRRSYPESTICIAGPSPVIAVVFDPGIADSFLRMPPKSTGSFFRSILMIRRGRFDMAVLLPNSFRSALVVFLGGVKRRVGYLRDGRGFMLTDKLRAPVSSDGRKAVCPTLDYYADLLGLLDIDVVDRRMSVPSDPSLSEAELCDAGYDPARSLVMLNPGGSYGPSKLWPADRFASLADRLIDRFGAQVIINAAPNEKAIAVEVSNKMQHKPLLDYGRRENSLSLLKSHLVLCDLLVTNDTGARHLGVALGSAVVTIYGSTDPGWTTLDYDRQKNIIADVDCGP